MINVQLLNNNDEEMAIYQNKLNELYDKFVDKYGYLTSKGNKIAFSDDIDYPLLTALENVDEATKEVTKSEIFYKRTISPYKEITSVETSDEALVVSLNQKGRVDIEYMKTLVNKEFDEIVQDLEGKIFRNPLKVIEDNIESVENQLEDLRYEENELIELYSNVDMIIIDDLGTEKISQWALEKLYTIIENRNENRLPIIITTRFDKQGLIERFSQSQDEQLVEAIISKLYQMCYGITLKNIKEKELV